MQTGFLTSSRHFDRAQALRIERRVGREQPVAGRKPRRQYTSVSLKDCGAFIGMARQIYSNKVGGAMRR
jgi:hypothetical protein